MCLSILAQTILRQLVSSPTDSPKVQVLLSLMRVVSQDKRNEEFRTIFLNQLYKRCPYTLPYYPKLQPTMNDEQRLQ